MKSRWSEDGKKGNKIGRQTIIDEKPKGGGAGSGKGNTKQHSGKKKMRARSYREQIWNHRRKREEIGPEKESGWRGGGRPTTFAIKECGIRSDTRGRDG